MVRFYTYLEVYLGDLSKSVSLSEFESHFKTPHQTIKKHLEPFTKAKVLIEEKKERFLFYKLNLDNPLTREYLLICEKERLLSFLEKNTLFARLYQELSQCFADSKILLFGSSTEKKEYSDIDLLIISKNKDIKPIIKKFQETYSVKIHAVQTEEKGLTKTFIQEIKQKHIIFNNHEYFMEVLYK
ncbi:MAG: nucleotidyltransferase domain-containing protein [Nanoarchaeota archaeon]